jgi:hypothetical protein
MDESTAMTLLAVALGIGVFYYFLRRMTRVASDARFRDLSDYFLIFKKALEILNEKRWLIFIPLGIAIFSWVLQFVSSVIVFTQLDEQIYGKSFGELFFSVSFNSPYYALSYTVRVLHYILANTFVSIGNYNIVTQGLIYFPVCFAFLFLIGFNMIRQILRQVGDSSRKFFRSMIYPTLGCSVVVLFLYGYFFGTYEETTSISYNWLSFSVYSLGHLWLGGLFFAFFIGIFTYVVFMSYSAEEIRGTINLDQVFANAKSLFFFWVLLSLMRSPAGYMLNPPPVGPALFPGLIFYFLLLLISFLLLFAPIIIVAKKEKLKNGLRLSLNLWKSEYPRILVFLVMAVTLLLVVRLFASVLHGLTTYSYSFLDFLFSLVRLCLQLFVNLWIMASWVGLFHKLQPEEIEMPGNSIDESIAPEVMH